MTESSDRVPTNDSSTSDQSALAATPTPTPTPMPRRDAHGFDPAAFDWIPVPRRRRTDGWSPANQRRFIELLADTGSVATAARDMNMSVQGCHALRRAPGAEGFAAAWDAAIDHAGRSLLALAMERVVDGEDVPVFNANGQRIAARRRYSDRMMMFLLRAYHPERFGGGPGPAAPPPPVVQPIAGALATLEPVTPAEPHRLMQPDELAIRLAEISAQQQREKDYATPHDPSTD